MGALYCNQGKYDSAQAVFERALEIRNRRFGTGDTLVAATLIDLADVANLLGERRRADSPGERRAADPPRGPRRAPSVDRHPSITIAMGRILSAQFGIGNLPQVDSTARAAVAMLRDLGLDRTPEAPPYPQRPGVEPHLPGRPCRGAGADAHGGGARFGPAWPFPPGPRGAPGEPRSGVFVRWIHRQKHRCPQLGARDPAGKSGRRQSGDRPEPFQPRRDGVQARRVRRRRAAVRGGYHCSRWARSMMTGRSPSIFPNGIVEKIGPATTC